MSLVSDTSKMLYLLSKGYSWATYDGETVLRRDDERGSFIIFTRGVGCYDTRWTLDDAGRLVEPYVIQWEPEA